MSMNSGLTRLVLTIYLLRKPLAADCTKSHEDNEPLPLKPADIDELLYRYVHAIDHSRTLRLHQT